MSVLADSKQRDVEEGSIGRKLIGAVETLQRRLVCASGLVGRQALRRHRMDIVVGSRNSRKEGVSRHPIITVAIVVRHEPFVTPEPVRTAPWKARRNCRIGKTLIQTPGGRTTRQAHGEGAVARLRETAQPIGNIVRERFSARESPVLARYGASHLRDDLRLHDALGRAELARGKMNRSIALAKPSSL